MSNWEKYDKKGHKLQTYTRRVGNQVAFVSIMEDVINPGITAGVHVDSIYSDIDQFITIREAQRWADDVIENNKVPRLPDCWYCRDTEKRRASYSLRNTKDVWGKGVYPPSESMD